MKDEEPHQNIASETIIVSTEQGVVLTGNRMDAFEARMMASIRKPFYTIMVILMIMFVLLFGASIALSRGNATLNRLDVTVANTDNLVQGATGPEARERQQAASARFLAELSCQWQKDLQKIVDSLVERKVLNFPPGTSVVDERCLTPETTTTTTTTTPPGG